MDDTLTFRWTLKHLRNHVRYLLANRFRNDDLLKRNACFRGVHKGQTLFILGSGPTIKQIDLKRLAGRLVMTQNNFHVHPDIQILNPLYHCVVPKYQPDAFDDHWIAWHREMEERLPPTTRFFVGMNSRVLLDRAGLLHDRRWYIRGQLHAMFMSRAAVDISRTIMHITTALVQCLSVAIYMEFSRIILLGFDLDQAFQGAKADYGRFYGLSTVTRTQAERTSDAESTRNGYEWFNYWHMWKQFNLLREEAERRNTQIINATPGGILDCFERSPLDQVLASQ